MSKIIVTGGAGMIGSSLVLELLKNKKNVLVIDNLSSGKIENLSEAKKFKNFKFLEVDIKNQSALIDLFKKSSCVYHLAANPDIKFSSGNPTDKDLKENTIGTYNVLEATRINKIKKFIFASSSAIYGEPTIFPTPENYGPLKPISLYGASKLACESLISAYSHLFDIQSWIFRLANIVGDKSRKKGTTVITDFIQKLRQNPKKLEILGNGRQKKSFLWIEDCVSGILTLSQKTHASLNILNLGNKDSITVMEIARNVISEMQLKDVEISCAGGIRGWKGDSPEMLMDITFAKKFGWIPKFNSKEAVRKSTQLLISKL